MRARRGPGPGRRPFFQLIALLFAGTSLVAQSPAPHPPPMLSEGAPEISFILGTFFLIGFYHLLVWFLRREEKRSFWFGVVCSLFLLNVFLAQRSGQMAAPFGLSLYTRADIITLLFTVPAVVYFAAHGIPGLVSSRFPVIVAASTLVTVPLTLLFSGSILDAVLYAYGAWSLCVVLVLVLRAVRLFGRIDGAAFVGLVAIVLLPAAAGFDYWASVSSRLGGARAMAYAMFFFALVHTILMARGIATAWNRVDYLTVNLRHEVEKQTRELRVANQTLRMISSLDGLTGVANRRCFDEVMEKEWTRAIRNAEPISLLILDIDYFKRYNDLYGHLKGDACLVSVTRVLQLKIRRPADLLARYGGEEFAVLLPGTEAAGARSVAEAMNEAVREAELLHEGSKIAPPVITISVGAATMTPTAADSPNDLITRSDRALYAAKHAGRNRVVVFDRHAREFNDPAQPGTTRP